MAIVASGRTLVVITSCPDFDSQQLLLSCFSLFMIFQNDYLWFDYHFSYSCMYIRIYLLFLN